MRLAGPIDSSAPSSAACMAADTPLDRPRPFAPRGGDVKDQIIQLLLRLLIQSDRFGPGGAAPYSPPMAVPNLNPGPTPILLAGEAQKNPDIQVQSELPRGMLR